MTEIRRITQDQAAEGAALWNRMCRETPDGGPLTPQGLTNINRMLAMASFHHETTCLVACEGDAMVGFALARVDPGDGLLPCLIGELQEFYVMPQARGRGHERALAEAAIRWLRERDAATIRTQLSTDDLDGRGFWQSQGFEADMVVLSLYRDG